MFEDPNNGSLPVVWCVATMWLEQIQKQNKTTKDKNKTLKYYLKQQTVKLCSNNSNKS